MHKHLHIQMFAKAVLCSVYDTGFPLEKKIT